MTDAAAYPSCVHGKKIYERCVSCEADMLLGKHGGIEKVCDSAVANGEGRQVPPSAGPSVASATEGDAPISKQAADRLAELAKNAIKERDVLRGAVALALPLLIQASYDARAVDVDRSAKLHDAYQALINAFEFRADGGEL